MKISDEVLRRAGRLIERDNAPIGLLIHTRYEVRRLLELGCIDVLQTDLSESCGLLESKKMAASKMRRARRRLRTRAPTALRGSPARGSCMARLV